MVQGVVACSEPQPADLQRHAEINELVFAEGAKLSVDALLVCSSNVLLGCWLGVQVMYGCFVQQKRTVRDERCM